MIVLHKHFLHYFRKHVAQHKNRHPEGCLNVGGTIADNHITLLVTALLMVAGVQTAMAQKMVVKTTDNGLVRFDVSKVEYVTFIKDDFVDLDLPSGTLWASCNIGASSPEQYGFYFAWGETEEKNTYDWSTYFDTDDGGKTFKKYYKNGGLTELQPADDAATANWGSGWQMPSFDQINELCNSSYTTSEWTQLNGVYGRKVTSKSNGNSIFLPAAGRRWDVELDDAGSYGDYWSSSLVLGSGGNAYSLNFLSDRWYWNFYYRSRGQSVRAVRVQE